MSGSWYSCSSLRITFSGWGWPVHLRQTVPLCTADIESFLFAVGQSFRLSVLGPLAYFFCVHYFHLTHLNINISDQGSHYTNYTCPVSEQPFILGLQFSILTDMACIKIAPKRIGPSWLMRNRIRSNLNVYGDSSKVWESLMHRQLVKPVWPKIMVI